MFFPHRLSCGRRTITGYPTKSAVVLLARVFQAWKFMTNLYLSLYGEITYPTHLYIIPPKNLSTPEAEYLALAFICTSSAQKSCPSCGYSAILLPKISSGRYSKCILSQTVHLPPQTNPSFSKISITRLGGIQRSDSGMSIQFSLPLFFSQFQ
ncbi:MAG: hypothetical protein BWX81_00864 [Spirochaetes bacterium ADurb.Bin110]|nr:MAG: hypothetical protein BWX81_00864 [Spirochaetes bacterium ADurb.Bin110]